MPTPQRTIGRLSMYRRLLQDLTAGGQGSVYSHQLAALAGATAAQVRRDFTFIGYSGNPGRGYDVKELLASIAERLDAAQPEGVALVGVGNLGRAILAFFRGRRPRLVIQAAFDKDPAKANRVIQGCRCYPLELLESVVRGQGIRLGVVAVPASAAQETAEALTRAGVRGLLNFAPVPLRVPHGVYVEDIDMTMSLEKVAYFARQKAEAGSQK